MKTEDFYLGKNASAIIKEREKFFPILFFGRFSGHVEINGIISSPKINCNSHDKIYNQLKDFYLKIMKEGQIDDMENLEKSK